MCVIYFSLFLCTFSFLQRTGKQDPRCLRVNLLLLPIPHLQSIFPLCDNHSYEFIYTVAVPRGPGRDQHFIYNMQQNIAESHVTFFLNKQRMKGYKWFFPFYRWGTEMQRLKGRCRKGFRQCTDCHLACIPYTHYSDSWPSAFGMIFIFHEFLGFWLNFPRDMHFCHNITWIWSCPMSVCVQNSQRD